MAQFQETIIKTVANRCHFLKLKCTKFDFGCGSAPDPAGGAYSAPPDVLAGFKGAYFQLERGKGKERGKGGKKRCKERGRGGEVEREGVGIAWPDL